MNKYPILYSPPMVDAHQAGRKHQTRRLRGLEYINANLHLDWSVVWANMNPIPKLGSVPLEPQFRAHFWAEGADDQSIRCPYGQIGDLLWVKETIQIKTIAGAYMAYRFADGEVRVWEHERPDYDSGATVKLDWSTVRKTPSMHMPKRLARIWLKIIDVRIQRLHDIETHEAALEGIHYSHPYWENYLNPDLPYLDTFYYTDPNLGLHKQYAEVASYTTLWEKLNGPGSWKKNPWVWVISTEPIDRPSMDEILTPNISRDVKTRRRTPAVPTGSGILQTAIN